MVPHQGDSQCFTCNERWAKVEDAVQSVVWSEAKEAVAMLKKTEARLADIERLMGRSKG